MSEPGPHSDATAPPPAFLQLHRALADLAMASGPRAPLAQHTMGRHLAFLPPEALELDLADPAQRDFGDYELLSKLGQGGMGVVYRARQKSLDREVAVKLLAAGPWASRDFIERFRREAQSAARMQHPGIVPIFEVGAHDELNYFSMQLVRGESLAGLLSREGALAPRRAAGLLRTVAEAVDYAHRLGVLHLDLKPGNVLIDERGEPQVADFGLARRLDETLAADSDEISGTPSYMAPEQAVLKSHKLSPATDVYGLGAMLYEFLTGRPPFIGTNPHETLKRVVEVEAERPSALRPSVPPDLEAICLKCLAKAPTERYGSARQLADDLARFLEGRAVLVRPLNGGQRIARWARREPRLAAAIAVAVTALLLGAVISTQQWLRAEAGAANARAALWTDRLDTAWQSLPRQGPLSVLPAMVANLAEQEAAGATVDADRSRTRLGTLTAAAPQLIDLVGGDGAISSVAIGPDGDWVASLRSNVLAIHDVSSGVERCRTEMPAYEGLSSAPGYVGGLRPVGDGARMLVVPVVSSVPPQPPWEGTLIETRDCTLVQPPPDRFGAQPATTWSPDAEFAIVRRSVESAGELIRVRDWSTLATVGDMQMRGNSWLLAPGLAHVVLAADQGRRLDVLDPSTMALRHRYVHAEQERLRVSAWTRQGDRLALAYADGQVLLIDPATGITTLLEPRAEAQPSTLAFDATDAWLAATFQDGSVRVWNTSTGRPATRPIRNPAGWLRAVPDVARRTVFVQTRRAAQLWSTEGPSEPVLLWQRPEATGLPFWIPAAWHADASLLATGNEGGELRLWRAPTAAAQIPAASPPLAVNEADPPFDGRHVIGVQGATVVIFDLDRGAAAAAPIVHAQAVSFALLAADSSRLVTSAGRILQVHDWRRGVPAYAPIELESTPTLVALAPITEALLVGYSARNGERNVTVLESYVLATGLRSGRVELDGLHGIIGLSSDGQRVVTSLAGTVHVLDAITLEETWPPLRVGPDALAAMRAHYAVAGPIHADMTAVRGATVYPSLAGAADTLWLYVERSDAVDSAASTPRHQLLAIDAASGRLERTLRLDAPVASLRALAGNRVALLVPTRNELRIVARDGTQTSIPLDNINSYAGAALSADGRRLGIALSRGAAVFDADSGEWLTSPLAGGIAPGDVVSGLSFDRTGSQLLVRTIGRQWVRHRLSREERPLTEIQETQRWSHDGPGVLSESARPRIDEGARAKLRAGDPGAPKAPAAAPALSPALAPTVAPTTEVQPRFVDLAPACTTKASDERTGFAFELGRVLPPGRHRLLGVDFEVGCGVRVSMLRVATAAGEPLSLRSREIPLSLARFGSFELLVTGDTLFPDLADVPYAWIELGYRDGGTARLPITYRRQIWEHWQSTPHGGDARVAYYATSSRDATGGGNVPTLFAVTLNNPHPQREVEHLVLEAVDRPWSTPLLLAVTLDASSSTSDSAAERMP